MTISVKPITKTKKPKVPSAPQKSKTLKGLELRQKELEIQGKELDIKFRELELEEKRKRLDGEDDRLKNEIDKVKISKLDTLRWLLTSWDIDEEQTQVGSELKFKNTFDESDRRDLKTKIYNILKKL